MPEVANVTSTNESLKQPESLEAGSFRGVKMFFGKFSSIWLCIIVLLLLYFGSRIPSLYRPLRGEEGKFAALFVSQPSGPENNLGARIDGEEVYYFFKHPAPMYDWIRLAGVILAPIIPSPPRPDSEITPRLRFSYSLFQFLVWLGLFAWLWRDASMRKRYITWISLSVCMLSPLAIHTSVELQTDGSVGILLSGSFALALLWRIRHPHGLGIHLLLFAASFFASTGKQEWSIVVLFAVFTWLGYLIWQSRHFSEPLKIPLKVVLPIVTGVLLGNLASYAYDPVNYLGGLNILVSQVQDSTIVSENAMFHHWFQITLQRLPWTSTLVLLCAILLFGLRERRWRPQSLEVLLLIYGLGLFGCFFVSSWNSYGRYFAPSLVVLSASCAVILPAKWSRKGKRFVLAFATLILLHMAAFIALNTYRYVIHTPEVPVLPSVEPDEVPMLPTSYTWNKPELDFVNNSLSHNDAKTLVEAHGKHLFLSNK